MVESCGESLADESEEFMPGDIFLYETILKLSFEGDAKGVVEACELFRESGGILHIYGPYLYPALAHLGEYDAALKVANECGDDTTTPVDELKILFLANRIDDVIRRSETIIENPVWFGWGRDVVDAYLMRAECLRMKGYYFRAWQDVLSAFQFAEGGGHGPKVFADIRRIGKRVRREAVHRPQTEEMKASTLRPRLLGGPHFEGQTCSTD